MSTPSDQLSLPLPLFSSSSNSESRPRSVHASDCSLRPQRNIIRIKEEWWGPQEVVDAGETGSVEEEMQGQRERDSKRRKTTSNGLDEIARSSRLHEIDLRQSGSLALSTSPAIVNLSSNSPESPRQRPPSTPSQQDTRDTPVPRVGETGVNPSVISPRSLGPSLRENPSPAPQNPSLPPSAPRQRLRSANGFLEIPLGDLLHRLEFADFEPFITKRPVEPTHSLAFHRIQIEFFTSASNPAKWSTRYGSKIFNRPYFPSLTDKVINLQPNFEYIRQHYPLRLSQSLLDIPKKEKQRWEGLARVLDWIYGMKVKMQELVFFVESVPRPLLALLKLHVSINTYGRGISSVADQFIAFLQNTPPVRLMETENRARKLVDWLNRGVRIDQSELWSDWFADEVQRERDGARAKWHCWLEGIEGLRTIRDLERWEDDMKAANRWRRG